MSIDLDPCVMLYIEPKKEQRHKYDFQSQHNFQARIRNPFDIEMLTYTVNGRLKRATRHSQILPPGVTQLFYSSSEQERTGADFHLNIFPKHSDRNCF